jgi:hypothetical protein
MILASFVVASIGVDPLTILVNYGARGIMLGLVATGWFRTRGEVQVLKDQNAELREIITRFQTQATQTVPALARSVQVLEAIPNKEAGSLEEIRQIEARILAVVGRLESTQEGKP